MIAALATAKKESKRIVLVMGVTNKSVAELVERILYTDGYEHLEVLRAVPDRTATEAPTQVNVVNVSTNLP